jgi:hypothetical protein
MKALLKLHVQWINSILQEAYLRSSDDPEHQANIARAALANLTWLRTMEVILLQAADVHVIEPEDGPVS